MEVSEFKPGDKHFMAYVGRAEQYDFMGATQFRLLCSLGLRANHRLLDFGCGSLRAGRFFISYLNKECYYGIEPNQWLIDEAIENQIGSDVLSLKKPNFFSQTELEKTNFSHAFDFILAQSIFSHTDKNMIKASLERFSNCLKEDGIIAATFVEGRKDFNGSGWIYPECVTYLRNSIKKFASESGLYITRIPWYHPTQTWYLLSKNKHRLPNYYMRRYLRGAVLYDSNFSASWKISEKFIRVATNYFRQILPKNIKQIIKLVTKR